MSNIAFTVTNAGRALALNQGSQQLSLSLTHMVLSGTAYPGGTDLAAVTTVPSRLEKTAIDASAEIAVGVLDMTAVFPEYVSAPYGAMVLGLYAGDPDAGGTLFAVHNASTAFITRGMFSYALSFSLDLTGSGLTNVAVQVSQNAAIAQALMATHAASANPHPQYALLSEMSARLALLEAQSAPTGMFGAFDLGAAPAGWLVADGGVFLSADHPALAVALGTRHNAEYGVPPVGYTRLPDGRGVVLRGVDLGRGIDPGRALGSYQGDQNLSHSHGVNDPGHSHDYETRINEFAAGPISIDDRMPIDTRQTSPATTGISIEASGGNEARMKNMAVLICIKT